MFIQNWNDCHLYSFIVKFQFRFNESPNYSQTLKSIIWASSELRWTISEQNYSRILIAEEGEWEKCIQGSTAVVNLAGLPISTRWSPEVVFRLCFFSFIIVLGKLKKSSYINSQESVVKSKPNERVGMNGKMMHGDIDMKHVYCLVIIISDFPSKYRSRGRLNKAELMLLPRYLKCLIFFYFNFKICRVFVLICYWC